MKASFKKLLPLFALSLGILLLTGCQKEHVQPLSSGHSAPGTASSQPNTNTNASKSGSTDQKSPTKDKSTTTDKSAENNQSTNQKQATSQGKVKSSFSGTKTAAQKKGSTIAAHSPSQSGTSSSQKSGSVHTGSSSNQSLSVTVTVTGYQNKVIVAPTKVVIKKGETFLDVTLQILKEKGIQYSVKGSGAMAYVVGMDNLYEFDKGPKSGWIALKNGEKIKQSAGITSIQAGDAVKWAYTTGG